MQVTINRDVIKDELIKVNSVVRSNTTIPILKGIFLQAKKEEILIIGSDGTETIKCGIPVDGQSTDVIREGSTVVPTSFFSIIKKLNKKIELTLTDNIIEIKSGRSLFELNCMDSIEYPNVCTFELEDPILTLSAADLKNIIKKTSFSASEQETRPILTGVHFNFKESNLTVSATDSHRLSQLNYKKNSDQSLEVVIPAKTVNGLLKVISDEEISVYLNKQQVMFKNGSTFYSSRLLEGTYPDVSRLIPSVERYKTHTLINKSELIQALEIASIASEKRGVVKLEIKESSTITSSHEEISKNRSKVEVTMDSIEGDELLISFSASFMIDALKSVDSELVSISFEGAERPFVIRPGESKGNEEIQLILPVRTY